MLNPLFAQLAEQIGGVARSAEGVAQFTAEQ